MHVTAPPWRAPAALSRPDPLGSARRQLLLLWPTLSALWIAAGGFPGWHLLVVFVVGTFLMRSAGCAANDVADREYDRHVKRTATRPVTSGAVSVAEALTLGAALALVAFALVLTTNLAAVAWSVAALAVTLVYPFSKRFFAMPQGVLGIAFSFGIPMAFAAVRGGDAWSIDSLAGAVPALAWWLLFGNLFWVLAYDTDTPWSIATTTCASASRPRRSRSAASTSPR